MLYSTPQNAILTLVLCIKYHNFTPISKDVLKIIHKMYFDKLEFKNSKIGTIQLDLVHEFSIIIPEKSLVCESLKVLHQGNRLQYKMIFNIVNFVEYKWHIPL